MIQGDGRLKSLGLVGSQSSLSFGEVLCREVLVGGLMLRCMDVLV